MGKFLRITISVLVALVSFTACRDNEEVITPSGNYSPIRGGFPQGDSEYDKTINDIKNEWGVYLLYKDVTEEDMNRTWVSIPTKDIYVGGDASERDKGAWDLPMEHLPYYVDFFQNYIFPNITKDFAHSTFPVKIYMINNLRTEKLIIDEEAEKKEEDGSEDNEAEDNEAESTTEGTDTNPNKVIKLGDFDNWAVSFPDSVITGKNSEYALKQMRCIFMLEVIKNAMDKGEITSPDEFWSGFDFSEDKKMEHKDPSKDNYKYKLGFIDEPNDNFGTGQLKQFWRPLETSVFSCYYWEKGKHKDYDLFKAYIKNALWLTPEDFEERYPSDLYPMLTEKYNIVTKHMLDKYGINLIGIARGKEQQE